MSAQTFQWHLAIDKHLYNSLCPSKTLVSTPRIYLSLTSHAWHSSSIHSEFLSVLDLELPGLRHYFPELAPICRLSGLMGSDVKIYHNLQFARPLPPVMMPQPAALSLRMNEWAAPSGGEGGGVYLGPGAILVIWSSELASHNPDPAINISLKQSFVTLLNRWNDLSVYSGSSWNLPFNTCLMLQLSSVFLFIVW